MTFRKAPLGCCVKLDGEGSKDRCRDTGEMAIGWTKCHLTGFKQKYTKTGLPASLQTKPLVIGFTTHYPKIWHLGSWSILSWRNLRIGRCKDSVIPLQQVRKPSHERCPPHSRRKGTSWPVKVEGHPQECSHEGFPQFPRLSSDLLVPSRFCITFIAYQT